MTPRTPAPPLEWHPWYAGKTWLLDWLNGVGEYGDRPEIQVPIQRPLSFTPDVEASLLAEPFQRLCIRRQTVHAPAAWTGLPYFWEWNIGVDEYGRQIAGESRAVTDTAWLQRHHYY